PSGRRYLASSRIEYLSRARRTAILGDRFVPRARRRCPGAQRDARAVSRPSPTHVGRLPPGVGPTGKELSMGIPYRARVNERWFLNLPGFHGGAYVVAYVEDTSERTLRRDPQCDDDCRDCPHNFEPRMILEIADCEDRINLEF